MFDILDIFQNWVYFKKHTNFNIYYFLVQISK